MPIIRYSRKRKFHDRNKKNIKIIAVSAVWFAGIFCVTNLTSSPTSAFFSDSMNESIEIQAGTWWDGSILSFVQTLNTEVEACEPTELYFTVENKGFSMIGPTTYDVLYNGGSLFSDRILHELENNQSGKITVPAEKPGTYHIVAEQRPGFNKEYDHVAEFKSETINVTCPPPPKEEQKKEGEEKNKNPDDSKDKEVKTNETVKDPEESLPIENIKDENISEEKVTSEVPVSEEPAPADEEPVITEGGSK